MSNESHAATIYIRVKNVLVPFWGKWIRPNTSPQDTRRALSLLASQLLWAAGLRWHKSEPEDVTKIHRFLS